ncbi:hypothetical protein BDN71DRAFT_1508729 [Pleurotus eryngii]|uniref:Uncharacterized protein n=1 Tax=Pleurotus eryngii TaxID=5323 RepID=A0A9P6DEI6_PLEER|nr:hypothetical protein BDN71DRAFT_1508729 [Pleurotus eryngii]
MADFYLELANEEVAEATPEIASSELLSFLCSGLDIEEKQHALAAQAAKGDLTTNQTADFQEQCNSLLQ